jgi:hypothetical protein
MKTKTSFLMAGLAVAAVMPSLGFGAPIDPNNLVIYRVGDGAAALGTTGTRVFLDEYTTTGTLVQSISISSAVSDPARMVAVGNATTEGIMTRSQDGQSLVFTGYRKGVGESSVTGGNKVIGNVKLNGVVATSIEMTDMSTNTIRSATTTNGSSYHIGASGSVRYLSNPMNTTGVTIDARNSRQVSLFGDTLYASNGSTALAPKLQHYGVNPTGVTTATPIITFGDSAQAINGFMMLDLSTGVAGYDTAYAINTVGNTLLKYTFNGTTWSATGSVSASGANNITAIRNGSSVDLYMTTSSQLRKLTDATGFGGTLSGASSLLATASTNTGFRGISSFNAVPEPSSLLAIALGAIALLRRKKN